VKDVAAWQRDCRIRTYANCETEMKAAVEERIRIKI